MTPALLPIEIDSTPLAITLIDSINRERRRKASPAKVTPPATVSQDTHVIETEQGTPQANSNSLALTLLDSEEGLTAFLDTADLVPPEQEEEFLDAFHSALATAADKRDRVAHVIARLEAQQDFAAAEIKRLQQFKRDKEAEQSRLEGYVSYVIERLGRDAKGKFRKLEGNTSTLFLRTCPASVEVTDESAIPLDYQNATVTMPAFLWLSLLDHIEQTTSAIPTATFTADKRAIKAAIEAKSEVPGARLVTDKTNVGRK